MCIRDRPHVAGELGEWLQVSIETPSGPRCVIRGQALHEACLLYTSDAADERSSVDLGGRRIIKKKKNRTVDAGVVIEAILNNQKVASGT